MHQSVEESAGCENHGLCTKSHTQGRFYTLHYPTLDDEFIDRILPHVQVWRVFEHRAPLEDELLAVAL